MEWLRTGMFKDEDEPITVTDEEGNQIITTKSSHIARILVNAEIFKSHDRHIRPEDCMQIGLKILLLEDDPDLQDAVLSVHHACIHTLAATPAKKIIENHNGKAFIQFAPVT